MAANCSTPLSRGLLRQAPRLQMLAIELHALRAVVFIQFQPVGESYIGTRSDRGVLERPADVAEGNRIESRGARLAAASKLQLEVLAADDARVRDAECAVEDRLGKSLPPGAGAAQHARRLERELGAGQLAVGVEDAR